ncbi:MAG: DNA-directed RNA polymerase subunit alpha, partial [Actinomycetota bacterium]|nr:DNA-directed RNA polymerase subunit alpha [Actinomycetota bacterium]
LFGLLRELNFEAEGIEVGPSPSEAADIANFSMPIEDMDLTVRSYNCLKREGIHTVGELVTRSEADLLDIRNFGQKSIDEVKLKLAAMGLALKDSPAGFGGGGVETFGSDYDETYGGQFSGSGLSSGTPEVQAAAPADDTDYAETEEL